MTLPAKWGKWKQRGFQQRARSRKKQNGEESHFFKLEDADKFVGPFNEQFSGLQESRKGSRKKTN